METVLKWLDVIAKTAVALAAAWASYQFSSLKQQNDDIQLIVNLLYSDNELKASTGLQMLDAYYHENRIPDSFYSVLIGTAASTSKNEVLRRTAQNSATEASLTNAVVAKQISQTTANLPARVYFHVSRREDAEKAEAIGDILRAEGTKITPLSVAVPGVEFIDQRINKTQVRCFQKDECDALGAKFVEFLKSQKIDAVLADFSTAYANSTNIRRNHFEVFFAPINLP